MRTSRLPMTAVLSVLVAFGALAANAAPVAAAAGDLDATFSGNGWLTIDFGEDSESANAVAVQPDGKLVVVGRSQGDVAVARIKMDGTLDDSFGGDGRVVTDLRSRTPTATKDEALGVAVQPDGKIVVVGRSDDRAFVVRYTPAGKLDTAFSDDGKLLFKLNAAPSLDWLKSVAIMADGRIVAAGRTGPLDGARFAVVRLTSDGDFDPTFSGDGKREIFFEVPGDVAQGMAVDDDGSITLGGGTRAIDLVAARVQPTGGLDTSYGPDGTGKYTDDEGFVIEAHDSEMTPDARVVTVAIDGHDQLSAVIRRSTPDGQAIDQAFGGGDGTAKVCDHCRIDAITFRANGEILAVGTSSVSGALVFERLGATGLQILFWSPDALPHTYGHDIVMSKKKAVIVGDRNGIDFIVARYLFATTLPPP